MSQVGKFHIGAPSESSRTTHSFIPSDSPAPSVSTPRKRVTTNKRSRPKRSKLATAPKPVGKGKARQIEATPPPDREDVERSRSYADTLAAIFPEWSAQDIQSLFSNPFPPSPQMETEQAAMPSGSNPKRRPKTSLARKGKKTRRATERTPPPDDQAEESIGSDYDAPDTPHPDMSPECFGAQSDAPGPSVPRAIRRAAILVEAMAKHAQKQTESQDPVGSSPRAPSPEY